MSENHVHNFKITKVPATCKDKGYTLYKCDCGYEHKIDFTPEGPHKYIKIEEKQPTCTTPGYCKYACEVCGQGGTDTIPPTGHSWGQWSVSNFPTCTQNGMRAHKCQVCGVEEVQPIPATGHVFAGSQKVKGGKNYFCRNCGETIFKPNFFKKHKGGIIALSITTITVAILAALTILLFIPMYYYNTAQKFMDEGNYNEARIYLNKCLDYKDSKKIFKSIEIVGYETEIYEYDNGWEKIEITYDKNLNPITVKNYVYGLLSEKSVYTYDDKGNEKTHVIYDSNDKILKQHMYENTYDTNGRLIQQDDTIYKTEIRFEYDNRGNLVRKAAYDDNIKTWEINYEYDALNNLVCEIHNDSFGEKTQYYFEYNYNNELIRSEWKWYNNKGSLEYSYVYTYNGDGSKLSRIWIDYGSSRTYSSCEYEYKDPIYGIKEDK